MHEHRSCIQTVWVTWYLQTQIRDLKVLEGNQSNHSCVIGTEAQLRGETAWYAVPGWKHNDLVLCPSATPVQPDSSIPFACDAHRIYSVLKSHCVHLDKETSSVFP